MGMDVVNEMGYSFLSFFSSDIHDLSYMCMLCPSVCVLLRW